MEKYIQIITTTDRREEAENIAKRLVEKRLVSCAQILGPIKSIYWWKGNMEEAEEWMIFFKTKMELFKDVESSIKEIHSYEVPEIIAVPITGGSKDYFSWIEEETQKS